MTVYVDDVRHKFGRMYMCHMWADLLDELHAMADAIGVARKWLQEPPKASWVHYDICLSKKARAIALGASLTDKFGPLEHKANLCIEGGGEVGVAWGKRMLVSTERCRARTAWRNGK